MKAGTAEMIVENLNPINRNPGGVAFFSTWHLNLKSKVAVK